MAIMWNAAAHAQPRPETAAEVAWRLRFAQMLIASGFEARLTAHYTRYFYAFDPVPGDPHVAGGAVDELLGLGIGVAYAY